MWVERCGDIIEMLGEGDGDMIEVWVELEEGGDMIEAWVEKCGERWLYD